VRFAQYLPGPSIDIDEHDTPALNELEPIGHGRRIIFGPEVLHAALGGQHACLDLAERTDVAVAQIAPRLPLFVCALLRIGCRGERDEKAKGKDRRSPTHDAKRHSPCLLNSL